MKKQFIGLMVVVSMFLSVNSYAYDLFKGEFDPMSKTDWALQGVFATTMVIDWMQTRSIRKNVQVINGNGYTYIKRYEETNPILGRNPSDTSVDLYFAGSLLAHSAITYILPKEYRHAWQCVFIGVELGAIAHNINAGLRIKF